MKIMCAYLQNGMICMILCQTHQPTLCLITHNSLLGLIGPYHVYLKHAYRAPIALCHIPPADL